VVIFSYLTIRSRRSVPICVTLSDEMFSMLAATPALVASRGECTTGQVVFQASVVFRCTPGGTGKGRLFPLVVGLGPFGGKGQGADGSGAPSIDRTYVNIHAGEAVSPPCTEISFEGGGRVPSVLPCCV
jgi:hypothetical protein